MVSREQLDVMAKSSKCYDLPINLVGKLIFVLGHFVLVFMRRIVFVYASLKSTNGSLCIFKTDVSVSRVDRIVDNPNWKRVLSKISGYNAVYPFCVILPCN